MENLWNKISTAIIGKIFLTLFAILILASIALGETRAEEKGKWYNAPLYIGNTHQCINIKNYIKNDLYFSGLLLETWDYYIDHQDEWDDAMYDEIMFIADQIHTWNLFAKNHKWNSSIYMNTYPDKARSELETYRNADDTQKLNSLRDIFLDVSNMSLKCGFPLMNDVQSTISPKVFNTFKNVKLFIERKILKGDLLAIKIGKKWTRRHNLGVQPAQQNEAEF